VPAAADIRDQEEFTDGGRRDGGGDEVDRCIAVDGVGAGCTAFAASSYG